MDSRTPPPAQAPPAPSPEPSPDAAEAPDFRALVERLRGANESVARALERERADEERHRLIIDSARDYAIIATDPVGCIESWSPGAEEVFGWSAAEVVGRDVAMTFLPDDRALGVPHEELREARESGVAADVRWHLRRDGRRVFIEGTTRPIRDGDGTLRGFLKVGQDVTRRRELDEALRASEARYRALVDNVRDYAIVLLDAGGCVVEWTGGARRVLGYTADEVIGRHVSVFYAPEELAAGDPARELAEAAAHGRAEREGWRVRKGGERFWGNEIATPVHDGEGRLAGFIKITRDLTERRVAEEIEARLRAEAERDAWRRQLASAEEAERRRLARELHDQLGQHLTAFSLVLAETRRLIAAHPEAQRRLGQLDQLARMMTRDARYLALELRPPELDDVGLESALATYVAQWRGRFGLGIELAVTGDADGRAIPPDVGTALYRIAQEALTNVAKHARAGQVSVTLEKAEQETRLVVEDDGRGFAPEAAFARSAAEGRLGLAGMRERAALVGGNLEVESRPGDGTTIYVRVPAPAG